MMFLLILSFITRNIINFPLMWIIEMAQFTITAYYLLGGGYSMLSDDHVRMDLFYGKLSKKHKLQLIPFLLEGVAQKPEFNLSDGMHPNDQGTIIIGNTLKKAILENL